MAKNRFIRNISASTLQLFINQLFGFVIFLTLSATLDKTSFGQLNWCLAVLLVSFGVLALGADQMMVKKIAAGYNRHSIFKALAFHVLFTGIIFYLLLLSLWWFVPHLFTQQKMLLWLALGKLCLYFSLPLKQMAAGMEKFSRLFFMSVVSNIARGFALIALSLLQAMNMTNVLLVFIGGDVLELLLCIFAGTPLLNFSKSTKHIKKLHWLLLKESLPQAGVVVFSAVISRFDWIIVGLLVSGNSLAEYSFAWKAYEIASLPLFIVAPLMIPMFTRLLKSNSNENKLFFFLEWQIMTACFVALIFNMAWAPLADFVTHGKYGTVNSTTIFLLSLAMPLLYLNNYLWTIHFAKGNLKQIFGVMVIAFMVNITGCLILIPLFKKEGAALANLLTMLIQLAFYLKKTNLTIFLRSLYALLRWPVISMITGFVCSFHTGNAFISTALATSIFLLFVWISKRLRLEDWKTLQSLYQ